MTTSLPTLSYQSSDTTPAPSILHAFASGMLLAIFLHVFAAVIGGILAGLLLGCGVAQIEVLLAVAALPVIGMFLMSIHVFLRERWLGFLVGASISVGAIPMLLLLPVLGRF